MRIKIANLILVGAFFNMCQYAVWAQIPVEVSLGHSSYYYQHSFAARFNKEKPLGFFHASSILIPYDKNRGNEIMSQSYLSYTLNNTWSTGVGSIFTPLNRVRPSFFLQYFRKGKTTSVMVYPRIDLWENPNLELMGFIEYKGTTNQKLKLYARLQYMTTWNSEEHVRSYQYLRIGFSLGDMQLGAAANFDQYGNTGTDYNSIGFFIRKEF